MRRCRDAHRPQNVARAEELDKRAMEGRGTDADLAESLAIFWPAYFAEPATAPPFPELDFSVEAYAATFESVHDELPGLAARLAGLAVPTLFVHGGSSPMPVTASTDTAEAIGSSATRRGDRGRRPLSLVRAAGGAARVPGPARRRHLIRGSPLMPFTIDTDTPFGERAQRRLREEQARLARHDQRRRHAPAGSRLVPVGSPRLVPALLEAGHGQAAQHRRAPAGGAPPGRQRQGR